MGNGEEEKGKGEQPVSGLENYMGAGVVEIRILEGGGFLYIKAITSVRALTHLQGLWIPYGDVHSIWIFCHLFHGAWLLLTPERNRITDCMVLT